MTHSDNDHNTEQHGGNLSFVAQHYPDAPRPLIDLSTGINPYAYPFPAIDASWLHHLPDNAATAAVRKSASRYYGAGSAGCIALAAGMQPLMVALASRRHLQHGRSRVSLLSPSYSEHARVWKAAGHEVRTVTDVDNTGDVVIICNPNNPDGKLHSCESLLLLVVALEKKGGWLLVDESFGDLIPELSLAAVAPDHNNLVVLRSCGKFFGAAGLRASCAIGNSAWMGALRDMMGPWPLSTLACHVLPGMFTDTVWIEQMRTTLKTEAAQWRDLLALHFSIVGHTDLFTLVESEDAPRWFDHFAAGGVLVRKFDYNARWLRLGLPDINRRKRIEAMVTAGVYA